LDIRELLNEFSICSCEEFMDEFLAVLGQCQNPSEVMGKLVFCLQRMKESPNTYFMENCNLFESIKGHNGIYAITIQKTGSNVRVLHARVLGKFIFLLAFYKKEGKKATDYSKHAPIADTRLRREKAKIGGSKNGCKH